MLLGVLDGRRRCRRGNANQSGDVIAHVVLELILVDAEPLRRFVAEHLKVSQPHTRVVRWGVRAEDQAVARHLLGELDDAGLEQPSRLAVHVGRIHDHPECLKAVDATSLHAEVADHEIDVPELADDGVELRRDRVRAVASVDEDDHAEFKLITGRGQDFEVLNQNVYIYIYGSSQNVFFRTPDYYLGPLAT